ncbi:MAG: hypothetical protein SPJ55_02525 [Treponema sp.]|nr:hypothetical protein [Treponema sp.]
MKDTIENVDVMKTEFIFSLNFYSKEIKEKEEQENYETTRKYYVYALCEKKDGKLIPFYIGKGTGARVWNHKDEADKEYQEIQEEYKNDKDKLDKALVTLDAKKKKIKSLGNNISHIIIKSGLTEYEAFMCESSLINLLNLKNLFYPNENELTNKVNGHSNKFEKEAKIDTAAETVEDYVRKYCKKPIIKNELDEEQEDLRGKKIFLQNINRTYNSCINKNKFPTIDEQKKAILEAVRGFWDDGKPEKMDYVFAMYEGKIKGVYKVIKDSNNPNFHKILDVNRNDYPRFASLDFRKEDNKIADAIMKDLSHRKDIKIDINDPYTGLEKNNKAIKKSIYKYLTDETKAIIRNSIGVTGEKTFGNPNDDPKKRTEIEYYNHKLSKWANKKYFVLEEYPEFYKYINCSILEKRDSEYEGILTGKKKEGSNRRSKSLNDDYLFME